MTEQSAGELLRRAKNCIEKLVQCEADERDCQVLLGDLDAHLSQASERADGVMAAWIFAYTSLGADKETAERMVKAEIAAFSAARAASVSADARESESVIRADAALAIEAASSEHGIQDCERELQTLMTNILDRAFSGDSK